jgi:hypothetical protein
MEWLSCRFPLEGYASQRSANPLTEGRARGRQTVPKNIVSSFRLNANLRVLLGVHCIGECDRLELYQASARDHRGG